MPIYEFFCRNCNHEFEQILPFSAQSMPHCPNCNSNHVDRRVGRPAIHFKGSGWYITDSKASKDSTTASSNNTTDKTPSLTETSTSPADSNTKSETKSETKSDEKRETKSDTKGKSVSVESAS